MNRGGKNQVKARILLTALILFAMVLTGCGNQEAGDAAAEISQNQATGDIRDGSGEEEREASESSSDEAYDSAEVSSEASGSSSDEADDSAEVSPEESESESGSGASAELTPAPSNTPAAPTEAEINNFLKAHYDELEHDMTLIVGEVSDITPFQILSGIQWKSQNESSAVVKDGKIYALQPGEALFTAKAGDFELFCNVVVTGYENTTLALNGSKTLPDDAIEGGLRLETDSPEIVAVEGNSMTAKAMGRSTLTVYMGETQYSFQVVVTDPQLRENSLSKIVGTTEQLYVYGTPSEIVWISDNEAIAAVDENGLVTASPGGIGQSTFIRAQVDGTELSCQVSVEAIPQLSTSYRIYGYSTGTDENGTPVENTIALYANANETRLNYGAPQAVLSMSSVKFTENTFPVYYAYSNEAVTQAAIAEGRCAHTQIYLLGTSEMAHVMVKAGNGEEVSGGTTATYTPQEGFGIIDVYIETVPTEVEGVIRVDSNGKRSINMGVVGGLEKPIQDTGLELVEGERFRLKTNSYGWESDCKIVSLNIGEPESVLAGPNQESVIRQEFSGTVLFPSEKTAVRVFVEVGGLTYQMCVDAGDLGIYTPSIPVPSRFFIDDDSMNADQYVTEAAQGGGQVQRAGSNSAFRNSSDSFVPGEWFEKMKGKFMEEVENQAVKMAVGFLFKLIFL